MLSYCSSLKKKNIKIKNYGKKILDENVKKVSGGTGEETKKLIEMSDILPPPSLTLRGGGFSVKNTNVSR